MMKCSMALDDLHRELSCRFSNFEKIDVSLQLVVCILTQDSETDLQQLQMEMIGLQSSVMGHSILPISFLSSTNESVFSNLGK